MDRPNPGSDGRLNEEITVNDTYILSQSACDGARRAAERGRQFVAAAGYPLGVAIIDHAWNDGSVDAVLGELGSYQLDDGGFGHGLEVDIASPASNPFATRLAMSVLVTLNVPKTAGRALTAGLKQWLVASQSDDGDWHFSAETKSGELAPWFAGWTFPSLNPACCVAGYANQLGLATPEMLTRVARLFEAEASIESAQTGDFYTLLPYVEYIAGIDWPDRNAFVEATVQGITSADAEGRYADAGHFWEHVLGGGSDIIGRLSTDVLARNATRLLDEQMPDGGWPTPYNDAWRPWITAQSVQTLARLRNGV